MHATISVLYVESISITLTSMPSCDETLRNQRPHCHRGRTSQSTTHTRRRFATPLIY
ncbi:hypothetical protein Hanom_Chr08g00719541 [Helianthus anomalus]